MLENGKIPRYKLDDFLKLSFERDYLINPLLPAAGIALLHGKGGHGKTQLAFTMMNEVTRGGVLLRKYPARQGRVLYFQFDMPEQLFQERLIKASEAFDETTSIGVSPYHKPINILEEGPKQQIADHIAAFEPDLIIFDTLRKIHPYDENDNAVPSLVYGAITEIAGGASVVVIHHDRKASTNQQQTDKGSEEDARESFRGARAWVDDCDLGIRLRMRRGGKVLMDFSKLRCAPQETMTLAMNQETLLLEPRGPETAAEWAKEIWRKEKPQDTAEWVAMIQVHARVGKTAAYNAVKAVTDEMAMMKE